MEFVLAAFGAFCGAAAAFGTDIWFQRCQAIRQEEAAINDLLIDLGAKRALIIDDDAVWAPGAGKRIVESIVNARDLVREARMKVRPHSDFLAPLRRMTVACATFLEKVEFRGGDPDLADVTELTQALRGEANAMRRIRPERIVSDRPGDLNYNRSIDRPAGEAPARTLTE